MTTCEPLLTSVEKHSLFSNLDALMDQPLNEMIKPLPFSEDIKSALIDHQGNLGHLLKCTVAYEAGDWDNVSCTGLNDSDIKSCYLESLQWATQLTDQIS